MSDRLVPGWVIVAVGGLLVAVVVAAIAVPRILSSVTVTPTPVPVPSALATRPPATAPPPGSIGAAPSALASADPQRRGEIRFGTRPGSDRCSVEGGNTGIVFTQMHTSDPVFVAAVLEHPVASGPNVRLLILGGAIPIDTVREAQAQAPASPQCWSNRTPIGPLAIGSYVFTVLDGTAEEATGILQVVQ